MTTLDRRLRDDIQALLEKARPDQLERLLADIRKSEAPPTPTHASTERLQ